MHEITFSKNIINQIKDKDNVIGIVLELGELAGITKGELVRTIKELTEWDVNVNMFFSDVKCTCGYKGRAKIRERLHDIVLFCCPECGNVPDVLKGKDIKIKKIVYK